MTRNWKRFCTGSLLTQKQTFTISHNIKIFQQFIRLSSLITLQLSHVMQVKVFPYTLRFVNVCNLIKLFSVTPRRIVFICYIDTYFTQYYVKISIKLLLESAHLILNDPLQIFYAYYEETLLSGQASSDLPLRLLVCYIIAGLEGRRRFTPCRALSRFHRCYFITLIQTCRQAMWSLW